MKKAFSLMLLLCSVLSMQCFAEPGDKDDWQRIQKQVTDNPLHIAEFNKIHNFSDGWVFVNRADKPFIQLYERHMSDGSYSCDVKENGSMKLSHVVSKLPCHDAQLN